MLLPYDCVTFRYVIVHTESRKMYAAFGKMYAERQEMYAETQNGAGNAYPAPRHSPAIDPYIIAQTARKCNTSRIFLQSAVIRVIVSLVLLRKYQGAAQNGRRLATPSRKGVERMPITITFHVFTYTITITVKSKSRHSAK